MMFFGTAWNTSVGQEHSPIEQGRTASRSCNSTHGETTRHCWCSERSDTPMRVLICGSRNWKDPEPIERLLDGYLDYYGSEFKLVEGEAPGADSCAADWAKGFGDYAESYVDPFPADWDKYGKGAGPIRNQQMLDEGQPDVVFAFSDDLKSSKGTKDMVKRALKAGLPVYVVSRPKLEDL